MSAGASGKTCNRCKFTLAVSSFRVFYDTQKRRDRLGPYCFECERILYRERYARGRIKKRAGAKRTFDPVKIHARAAVSAAIRSGELVRQPCVKCGGRGTAHHHDYSKPLDVVWLCVRHHAEEHRIPTLDRLAIAAALRATPNTGG